MGRETVVLPDGAHPHPVAVNARVCRQVAGLAVKKLHQVRHFLWVAGHVVGAQHPDGDGGNVQFQAPLQDLVGLVDAELVADLTLDPGSSGKAPVAVQNQAEVLGQLAAHPHLAPQSPLVEPVDGLGRQRAQRVQAPESGGQRRAGGHKGPV